MNALPLDDVRRIVLLWIGRLGDILIATPFMASVRARFPGARVTLVTGELGAAAARLAPALDAVRVLRRFHHPLENLRLVRELRAHEADLLVDLNSAPSRASSTLARLARARVKLTFARARGEGAYTHLIDAPSETEHMLDRYARLAEALGASYDPRPRVRVPAIDARAARDLLKDLVPPGGPLVCVHPGNFKKFDNRWPEDKFVALAARLSAVPGVRVFFLAGPGEEAPVRAIAERLETSLPVVGPLSTGVAAGLLSQVDLLIANVTGTAHLAIATGTPTFTFRSRYTDTVWMSRGNATLIGPAAKDALPPTTERDPSLRGRDADSPHFSVVSESWESCRDIPVDAAWTALRGALDAVRERAGRIP
ncbi:MAG: glycosyltransferase family 9 protein [Elusimicrobiota bacterium]